METSLLHFIPSVRWILRPQHVCRGRGGELPPVPRRAGEGGARRAGHQEGQEDRGAEEK